MLDANDSARIIGGGAVTLGNDVALLRGEVQKVVYRRVGAYAGSISAEHGIGLDKLPYMSMGRTTEELHLMKLIRHALDPTGILNPGKVIGPA